MQFPCEVVMNTDDLMFSDEYAEYIMENSKGDRIIANGDDLLLAMEAGYLFDEFVAYQSE